MRTLVVGDIHGGYRALQQVLERCDYNASNDQLIFLGDYVDGWSESAEVIQHLIEIEENTSIKPIFIRGNHNKWCEEWMQTGSANKIWVMQGGQATMTDYVRTGYITDDKHRAFFRKMHNYWIDDQNRGFTHGGFVSKNGLGHDPYQSDYYWDRDMWELAVAHHNNFEEIKKKSRDNYNGDFRPNAHRYLKHKEVYIGHTTTCNWTCKHHLPESKFQEVGRPIHVPMNRCNVWNMDTGGGYKGKLTILNVDTKEFWQSDFLDTLYPEERGR